MVAEAEIPDPEHPDAKKLIAEAENYRQWSRWVKPTDWITVPAVDGDQQVPEVSVAVYGTCAETGNDLLVFGTVAVEDVPYRQYAFGGTVVLVVRWTKDESEARRWRADAVGRLASARQVRMVRAVEAEIIPVRDRVGPLYAAHAHNSKLNPALRTRLVDVYFVLLGTVKNAAARLEECRQVAEEVERALADIEAAKWKPTAASVPVARPAEIKTLGAL